MRLQRFAQSHCCVNVDVAVSSTAALRESVRSGEMDLALTTFNRSLKLRTDIEPVFQERLVWAGLRIGVAFEKRLLPISVWEEGCSWRKSALASLEIADIDYRIVFKSAHISGQRAAILADLAVAPIPVSCCVNGIIELTVKGGLPKLAAYGVGMLVGKKPPNPHRRQQNISGQALRNRALPEYLRQHSLC